MELKTYLGYSGNGLTVVIVVTGNYTGYEIYIGYHHGPSYYYICRKDVPRKCPP